MQMTPKDIKKLQNIARVLGSAMAELEELAAKYETSGQPSTRKRRNLKDERVAKARFLLEKSRRKK
ncbi:hypothetical protein [Marinilabilia salmonicolor]|uniref:hypothetical protein n=1 Tax=Marinilabilia salmonicolor TaxID=989 RepID=UPI0011DF14B2|nr:hypothetical protein [Marinilabilia salmonicolor]